MVFTAVLVSLLSLTDVASALYIPHTDQQAGAADAVGSWPNKETHDRSSAQYSADFGSSKPIEYKSSHDPENSQLGSKGVVSFASEQDIIPDSYIVILKQSAPESALSTSIDWLIETSRLQIQTLQQAGKHHPLLSTETGFEIKRIYDIKAISERTEESVPLVRGYAVKLLPEVADLLANHPDVEIVERNFILQLQKAREEELAPWGLARVSHRDPLGLASRDKYLYDNHGGEGVTSYIVDTGIWVNHEDFEGRARWGKNLVADEADVDTHGHGSHCAGTVGGKTYGVAKKVNLVAVKVFNRNGQGQLSEMIAGIEYVVDSHNQEKKEKQGNFKGSTINFSAAAYRSPTLDTTFNAATEAGVHIAVAAGNDDLDACIRSPAAAEGPITVGATTITDERASFSNYGKCVDIFAPGENVFSVSLDSPTASVAFSGTSMASPHIAGLLAYFLSLQPTTDSEYATRGALTPSELKEHLISYGTPGQLKNIHWLSPNIVAYNGGGKDLSKFWRTNHANSEASHSFAEAEREGVMDLIKGMLDNAQEISPLSF